MTDKHIGSNFDDFLKEEGIEFDEKEFEKPSKEIIIDGVDVNSLYSEQIACMNRYEVANLFIKTVELLVSKEQECEELEKQNEILLGQLVINDGEDVTVQISQSQFEEYNQLKAENEEFEETVNNLIKVQYGLADRCTKYSQALTEIKEILLFNKKELEECLHNDIDGQIIQKCEVLDEKT